MNDKQFEKILKSLDEYFMGTDIVSAIERDSKSIKKLYKYFEDIDPQR